MPRTLALYFRLIGLRIRAQMQYRVSFVMDTLGAGFTTFVEFTALWLVFTRFGTIGGWTIGEVAFLYGLVETAFGCMDMLFSGFDPSFFGAQIQRGTFDQFLLRPLGLPLQMFTAEFVVRRLGRILNGAAIFALALSQLPITWTVAKLLYLPVVFTSAILFFGALFVVGATICFWTVESIEVINIFTYGGTYMLSYPMHIYAEWMRRFFTFVIPSALIIYYPALFFLDKPDPTGMAPLMSFLAPLAGIGMLALAFAFWNFGVRKYASTGT
ncbi:MAG: ABC-2 family transporter protein [Chloroflexi bacterium]|nr:ABC-2 family transporter protein [Chloroflexota bacterium]